MIKKYMQDMSWEEFKDRLEECGRTVIIPLGSTENHGYFPLWVDCYNCIGPLKRLTELIDDVIIAPLIPFSYSQYHSAYPGTISLSYDTCTRLYEEVAESLIKAGTERIVWYLGHGGCAAPLNYASRNLREKYGTLFVRLDVLTPRVEIGDYDQKTRQLIEGHGGAREGSVTLACVSEELGKDIMSRAKVYMSQGKKITGWGTDNLIDPQWLEIGGVQAKLTTSKVGDTLLSVFFPAGNFQDYTPPGMIVSDPAKQTAKYGKEIIEMAAQHLVKVLAEIKKIRVPIEAKPIPPSKI